MVKLAVEDDPDLDWLDTMPDIRVIRHGQDYTEAEVGRRRDPESILQAALERGARVTHFEIADPSLEQIFIEHVGTIDTSERTLAAPKAAGVAA